MQGLISIIVPVYNSEKTLKRCFDSLINQDYKNIEIILIDDGSKDKSGEICDLYAKKDQRIKVCHQDNQGESSARNCGLKFAEGEWITFCDSDDFVAKNYISSFLSMEELRKDTLYITGEKEGFTEKDLKPQKGIYFSGSVDKIMLRCLSENGSVWGKLFKRENINTNKFTFNTKIFNGPDKVFTMLYMMSINRIVYNNAEYPYSYINNFNPKKYIKNIDRMFINYNNIVNDIRSSWKDKCEYCWFINNFKLVLYSIFSQNTKREDRLKQIQYLVEEEQYSKEIIKAIIAEKGKTKIFFKWLLERKYKRVDAVFSFVIPIIINIFSKNYPIFIKHFLKRIG
jgi:glycosyltransferase involved in cell wall biosynthesis